MRNPLLPHAYLKGGGGHGGIEGVTSPKCPRHSLAKKRAPKSVPCVQNCTKVYQKVYTPCKKCKGSGQHTGEQHTYKEMAEAEIGYTITAISRLCQEESLKGLKDQRIIRPSTKHGTKNLAPLAPWPPHRYLSKLGGCGGAGGGVAYRDRARPPPPPPRGYTASQKSPRVLHVFDHWFLALHAFTHGFPTVQPSVPSPIYVQSFNHLLLTPHVFYDCIPTLSNTLHNSTNIRSNSAHLWVSKKAGVM